jgi:hypothetical protein
LNFEFAYQDGSNFMTDLTNQTKLCRNISTDPQ